MGQLAKTSPRDPLFDRPVIYKKRGVAGGDGESGGWIGSRWRVNRVVGLQVSVKQVVLVAKLTSHWVYVHDARGGGRILYLLVVVPF